MVHPNFKLADASLLLTSGWIADQPVPAATGRTFDVIDPANGDVWSTVPEMNEFDTDLAIAAATEAFQSFSSISARQRARMMLRFDALIRESKEDLAQLLVMESGKALVEARAEVD
jgi:acyl-CoA reductase-like NAD-dependent aldehyde dehydrogenase